MAEEVAGSGAEEAHFKALARPHLNRRTHLASLLNRVR